MILDEFDPAKPFYPLVLSYLCQVHGFFELLSRAVYQRFERFCEQVRPSPHIPRKQLIALFLLTMDEPTRKDIERGLWGGKSVLMWEPEPQSRTANGIKWDSGELAETLFVEHSETLKYFNRLSAGSLLILAWDRVPPKHRGSPIGQFLKHCRNAAAHNGAFHFKPKEPKNPAEWRTLTIVRAMQGDSLFADPPKPGFIRIGDVLYLLADIEKQFY